jgi:hypothetical protein
MLDPVADRRPPVWFSFRFTPGSETRDDGHVCEIKVRPPLAARIFTVLFSGSFVLYVIVGLVSALIQGEDISGGSMAIVMAVGAGTLGYRLAALSCRASGQELLIHNYWRTRRVPISQIEGLDLGQATAGNLKTVRVLARGRTIPIDVLGVQRGITRGRTARGLEMLEHRRQELADWLAAARSPGEMTGQSTVTD